jgi:PQQ-dependent catabolism-associated beta-propeller protein
VQVAARHWLALFAVVLTVGCRSKSSLVWVSLEDGNEVVAVDPDRGAVVARIPVGKRPRGIKLSPDGKWLYVALSGSPRGGPNIDESKLPPADRSADGIGVVDVTKRVLARTLRSGEDPESFDVSADGKTLYVSNEDSAQLTILDLETGETRKRVAVGKEPEGVTLRPDGKVVYVTSEQDGTLTAVDTTSFAVIASIVTGPRPRSIVFAADGSTAFVSNEFGSSVSVIDTRQNASRGAIHIEGASDVRQRPMGVALSADARRLYVTTGRGGAVAVIDVAKWAVVRRIDGVGARPWGIALSSDGKRLYTANGPSEDISVVDVGSSTVEKRVKVGKLPWGVAVAP